jgi:hypothetical protein
MVENEGGDGPLIPRFLAFSPQVLLKMKMRKKTRRTLLPFYFSFLFSFCSN